MDVSIIIPVYNVSAYIERCINSVIKQTYSGSIECILVDDCTPDDSIEKCYSAIGLYNGNIVFRVIHHTHNKGLSGARNTGTNASTGEYLFYLDSDDAITPNCIEILVNEAKKYKDLDFVQGYTIGIPDNQYHHIEKFMKPGYSEDVVKFRMLCYNYERSFPCNAWNKLLKSSFVKTNNLYFREGIIHEDNQWLFFLSKVTKRYSMVLEPTCLHFTTEGSIMTEESLYSHKHNESWYKITEDIINNIDEDYICQQLQMALKEYVARYRYDRELYSQIRHKVGELVRTNYGLYSHILYLFTISATHTLTFKIFRRMLHYQVLRKVRIEKSRLLEQ